MPPDIAQTNACWFDAERSRIGRAVLRKGDLASAPSDGTGGRTNNGKRSCRPLFLRFHVAQSLEEYAALVTRYAMGAIRFLRLESNTRLRKNGFPARQSIACKRIQTGAFGLF